MISNLQKLLSLKNCKFDGCLIVSPENRRYFTSFDSSDGYLLVSKTEAVFITDSRYIEAAKKNITDCKVRLQSKNIKQLAAIFNKMGVKKIGIEASRTTVANLEAFKNKLQGFEFVTDDSLDTYISALRSQKSFTEVELIKSAQAIAEEALAHTLPLIKEGVSEKDIQLELDYYMLRNGAEALSFETIAVAGKNSSMPHGVPSDYKIKNGDFITMDFGAVVGGYHSDMTRTVALGFATNEMKKVYKTVLNAQQAGTDTIKAGAKCSDADKAARDYISKAGYGKYFGHNLGHGVGVEIHEFPYLSRKCKSVLRPGNIVTSEPGIYIPDKFGVRIEDMILVTEGGNVNLTKADKRLIVL